MSQRAVASLVRLGVVLVASFAQSGSALVYRAPSSHIATVAPLSWATVRKEHHSYGAFSVRHSPYATTSGLHMAAEPEGSGGKSSLPFWLDPGTRGGAIVLSVLLFLVPLVGYSVVTNIFGVDDVEAGKWIGVGFTAIATVLWVGTYIFRVATKDMTYAKQLKDYENAVIAKRLEELDDDEIQALVEEIERDEF